MNRCFNILEGEINVIDAYPYRNIFQNLSDKNLIP
jgi:hypothetical protein